MKTTVSARMMTGASRFIGRLTSGMMDPAVASALSVVTASMIGPEWPPVAPSVIAMAAEDSAGVMGADFMEVVVPLGALTSVIGGAVVGTMEGGMVAAAEGLTLALAVTMSATATATATVEGVGQVTAVVGAMAEGEVATVEGEVATAEVVMGAGVHHVPLTKAIGGVLEDTVAAAADMAEVMDGTD